VVCKKGETYLPTYLPKSDLGRKVQSYERGNERKKKKYINRYRKEEEAEEIYKQIKKERKERMR
jgi:hypothetical protein